MNKTNNKWFIGLLRNLNKCKNAEKFILSGILSPNFLHRNIDYIANNIDIDLFALRDFLKDNNKSVEKINNMINKEPKKVFNKYLSLCLNITSNI